MPIEYYKLSYGPVIIALTMSVMKIWFEVILTGDLTKTICIVEASGIPLFFDETIIIKNTWSILYIIPLVYFIRQ